MMILMNHKVRSRVPENPAEPAEQKRGRGRPKGSASRTSEPEIRHPEVLGVQACRFPHVPNELWNRVVVLLGAFLHSLMALFEEAYSVGVDGRLAELVENLIPRSVLGFGCQVLEALLVVERGFLGSNLTCPQCCGTLKYQGDVDRTVKTRIGPVKMHRSYYYCSECGHSCAPQDTQLGVDGRHAVMPGLQDIVALLCATVPYLEAERILERLIPCKFSLHAVESITATVADEVQTRQTEEVEAILEDPGQAANRNGELEDWVAVMAADGGYCRVRDHQEKHREFKLAVFGRVEPREAYPVSSPGEADRKVELTEKSFVGSFAGAEQFYEPVNAEFFRRGFHRARTLHCVGDGADWVLPRLSLLAQEGQELSVILDWWHADERIAELARTLVEAGVVSESWREDVRNALWESDLDSFFGHLDAVIDNLGENEQQAELMRENRQYFDKRRNILGYKQCRERGLPIGSGMVEGGIRFIGKDRLDCTGMSWNTSGAEAVLQLRCINYSGRWDEYAEARASERRAAYQRARAAWSKAA